MVGYPAEGVELLEEPVQEASHPLEQAQQGRA